MFSKCPGWSSLDGLFISGNCRAWCPLYYYIPALLCSQATLYRRCGCRSHQQHKKCHDQKQKWDDLALLERILPFRSTKHFEVFFVIWAFFVLDFRAVPFKIEQHFAGDATKTHLIFLNIARVETCKCRYLILIFIVVFQCCLFLMREPLLRPPTIWMDGAQFNEAVVWMPYELNPVAPPRPDL